MKRSSRFMRGRRFVFKTGFTMVELLVSMAITSIIMVTLLSLIGQSTDTYTNTQRAVNSLSQARAFMQFFEKEISTNLASTYLLWKETTSSDTKTPDQSDKLLFFRTLTDDEQTTADPGDIGTTYYYVATTSDIGSAESPKLYRQALGPKESQELIEKDTGLTFPAQKPTQTQADAAGTNLTPDEAILYNVLGFSAQPQYRDSAGELQDWNSTLSVSPSVILLNIRFIDDSSSGRFKTKAQWDALAAADEDSKDFSLIRTFTRTIILAE